jgi:hypothetical protein
MVRLYVNGEQAGATAATGAIQPASGGGFIGAASAGSPEAERWNGLIDEVALYSRPLAAAEVKALACGAFVR